MEQQAPKSFRASVTSQHKNSILPNTLIVPDHKLYFTALKSEDEAYYLCGFLNSFSVRTWLGGFLLGKQIGTTIFEHMKVPQFDPKNSICNEIATISKNAHADRRETKNKNYLESKKEKELVKLVRDICS